MKEVQASKASLGDIARAAGVSKATACNVLRNRSGPSKATKELVLGVADQLGYIPDAHIASLMARVQSSKSKAALPIAWLNTNREKDAWQKFQFLSPYLEGAKERCHQLGYRIDELWASQKGMTMQRLAKILYQRGIEGAIITHPARHIRLNWNYLAGVSLEGALLAPRLNQVMSDLLYNLLLALKVVRRAGYRRIGIFLSEQVDSYSYHSIRATAYYSQSTLPKADRVPPLIYAPLNDVRDDDDAGAQAQKLLKAWLLRYRPDVVIGLDNQLVKWVEATGFNVPGDIGVVHLATDDDVPDWAGICSNKREIGRAVAEGVISLIQNRRFGVPDFSLHTLVRGTWHPGSTLLMPKPK